MDEDHSGEPKQFATFEKSEKFLGHLKVLLDADLFSDTPQTEEEREAIKWLPLIVRLN